MMEKGVSPIIAAVILIAFVIAVAGVAGPFMKDFISGTAEDVEDAGDETIDCTVTNFQLEVQNEEVWIHNRGQTEIPEDEWVIAEDGDDIESPLDSLGPGQSQTYDPSEGVEIVRITTSKCPQVSDSINMTV